MIRTEHEIERIESNGWLSSFTIILRCRIFFGAFSENDKQKHTKQRLLQLSSRCANSRLYHSIDYMCSVLD